MSEDRKILMDLPRVLHLGGDTYQIMIKSETTMIIQLYPLRVLSVDDLSDQDKIFIKNHILPIIKENLINGLDILFSEFPLDPNSVPGIVFTNNDTTGRYVDWDGIIEGVDGLSELVQRISNETLRLVLISYGERQSNKPAVDISCSALCFNGRGAGNLHQLRGTDERLQHAIISNTNMFHNKMIGILNQIIEACKNKHNVRIGIYCSKGHHRSVAVVMLLARNIFQNKVRCLHPHLNK
uniref:RapZ C-terminal domain-containing protein n=1 Tax=Marseillevirus LCMAC201 TaxID=2506605 RepID=A0A481YXD0_9VIRU|nr:MAG: hypothetical protein LCMAC201_04740 [Marseillevirus LCMAC201]